MELSCNIKAGAVKKKYHALRLRLLHNLIETTRIVYIFVPWLKSRS
jgi:hypothetical protein